MRALAATAQSLRINTVAGQTQWIRMQFCTNFKGNDSSISTLPVFFA